MKKYGVLATTSTSSSTSSSSTTRLLVVQVVEPSPYLVQFVLSLARPIWTTQP